KVRADSGGYASRTGYVWRGWNTKPDGSGDTYRADDWIVITKSISLYARWRKPEELHPGYPMNMTGTRTILDKDFVAANSPKPVERLTTDEIVARAKAERQKYFDALDAEQTPPPVREPWIFKTERDRWIGRLLYVALLGGIIWARHYHYSERGQLAARLRWHKRREKERRKVNQIEGSGGAKDSAKNHAAKSLADATTQTKDSGGGTKKEA
ncbi:InlB B-repeat-containing protein, partial [Treponema endosymbiont of Eucomonympha sp.]|uniref:InlB B-repeat-containing protein n=1 Tax=Treponema endosymbiont of Eucomonympha sp. TaxID=1580831 RepID=UPI000AE9F273